MNIYDSQFVVELCLHNFRLPIVEDEGAEDPARCLHLVLPLAELGLARTSSNTRLQVSIFWNIYTLRCFFYENTFVFER